jgi:hypothetical protein
VQHGWMLGLLLPLLLLPAGICQENDISESDQRTRYTSAMNDFFEQIDSNNDGQIERREASDFIGSKLRGQHYQTSQDIDHATEAMIANVDTLDSGATISQAELDSHFLAALQARTWWTVSIIMMHAYVAVCE